MEGVGSLIQTLRGFRVLEDASRFEEEMRSLKRRGPAMRRKHKKRTDGITHHIGEEEWIFAASIAAMFTVLVIQSDLLTRDCWLCMGRQDAHKKRAFSAVERVDQ